MWALGKLSRSLSPSHKMYIPQGDVYPQVKFQLLYPTVGDSMTRIRLGL